jgi:hypothetical protein
MYGITRIDHDKNRTHSWVVVISRKRKTYFRSFSDRTYGGKNRALAAAKRYRDEILATYPPMTLRAFCSILKSNNKSGISGVCRYVSNENNPKGGEPRPYWVARWSPEPRKTKCKKFSIEKYGEEEAFHLAVLARQRALKQLKGYFNPGMAQGRYT